MNPDVRWEPSRSPPSREEEDSFVTTTAMVVVLPEGTSGGDVAAAGASSAPTDASPAEGDARDRPIVLGKGSVEVAPPSAQVDRAPEPSADGAAKHAVEPPPHQSSAQVPYDGAPSGEVESTLALTPDGAARSEERRVGKECRL